MAREKALSMAIGGSHEVNLALSGCMPSRDWGGYYMPTGLPFWLSLYLECSRAWALKLEVLDPSYSSATCDLEKAPHTYQIICFLLCNMQAMLVPSSRGYCVDELN
jgi:hypothetical protein